jgi:hypothetical protein
MKAFEVTVKQVPKFRAIYKAETRSKARYKAYQDVGRSGYKFKFPNDFRVIRAQAFDNFIPRISLAANNGCIGYEDGGVKVGCLVGSDRVDYKPLVIKD